MPEQQKPSLPLAGELGALWCVLMHDSPMWPIHGEYQCRACSRRYPVPWAPDKLAPAPARRMAAPYGPGICPSKVVLADTTR
jgi:hypothetical protein